MSMHAPGRPALHFRRFSALIVGLLAAAGANAASDGPARFVPESQTGGPARLVIETPAVTWEPVPGGVRPVIDGFGRAGQVSRPDVPARRERVALPAGGGIRIHDISVEWEAGIVPGRPVAYPALDPARDELDPESGPWPEQPVRLISDGGAFRSLQFATFEIRPVQIDPGTQTFRLARTITIELDRLPGAGPSVLERGVGGEADRLVSSVAPGFAHGSEGLVGTLPSRSPAPTGLDSAPPSYPAWQFEVDEPGLYRISYSWAQDNADAYPGLLDFLTGNDPRLYSLRVQGIEVPIRVEGESDGSFDPPGVGRPDGDAIVFYGQPVVGDIMDPDVWQSGDFTDTNVYRLEIASSPARVDTVDGTPGGTDPVPASFQESVHHEPDTRFQGFVSDNGVDHWYYYPWINTRADVDSVDLEVDTPGYAGGPTDLRARLHSFDTASDLHRTEVLVDGELVDGCGDGDNGCVDWDGFREFTHGVDQGPVSFTKTLGPTTTVTIAAPLGRGTDVDQVMVNWVELDYDRLYEAVGDRLTFTAENADRELHVGGFSEMPEVWEISQDQLSEAGMEVAVPTRIDGASLQGSELRFEIDPDGSLPNTRRFVAAAGSGFRTPKLAREDLPPSTVDTSLGDSLLADGLGADWIVIAHRDLLFAEGSTTLGPELQALIDRRSDPAGQNLQTAVIDVQDIYDEFAYGLEEPQAIRDFLGHAVGSGTPPCAAGWDPAPAYVVLLGDAVWDHKNNYGYTPEREKVPTYMFDIASNTQFGHYPSDTWFAAVCGDDEIPDATVGRIAVHGFAESERTLRKLRVYETAGDPSSVTGKSLLVSEYEDGPEGPFVTAHDKIYDRWFAGRPQSAQKIYEQGRDGADADAANEEIDAAVNAGAGIISFVGHGGYKNWGKSFSIFQTRTPDETKKDDLEDILIDTPLLFSVQANCITGHFAATRYPGNEDPLDYSFIEDWITTERKGLVSGLAPSHLTFEQQIDIILDPVFEEIFGRKKQRLLAGIDARLRGEFDALSNTINLRSFVLQGDPATRLTVPAPAEPTITSIEPVGSGELRIEWTAPDDPEIDRFRIYRSTSPNRDYELAGETEDANTREFLDSGLANCREYFYYMTSVDADGFESRWSNFNDTCYGDRTDCESGTPENPDPPSTPVLESVSDTQRGGQLRVEWSAVPDADVTEYHVFWREESQSYGDDRKKVVSAPETSTTIGGLTNEVEYFVVVKAAHCSQLGDASNEKSGVPHLVRGLNPPDAINDLMVYEQGADLRLEWGAPTQSVWGTETSIGGYEVFGSDEQPAFPADAQHRLADLDAATTSWSHLGQASGGSLRWFYLVIARDADGYLSGAGAEVPAAVEDLRLRKASGGAQLELSWTRVARSHDDHRIAIASYNLYGRDSVLERAQTAEGNLLLSVPDGQGTSGSEQSVFVDTPAAGFFTYQLLSEDTHGTESVW